MEADSGTATSRALREHAAGGLQRRAHPAPPDSETERLVAGMPVRPTGWFHLNGLKWVSILSNRADALPNIWCYDQMLDAAQ